MDCDKSIEKSHKTFSYYHWVFLTGQWLCDQRQF